MTNEPSGQSGFPRLAYALMLVFGLILFVIVAWGLVLAWRDDGDALQVYGMLIVLGGPLFLLVGMILFTLVALIAGPWKLRGRIGAWWAVAIVAMVLAAYLIDGHVELSVLLTILTLVASGVPVYLPFAWFRGESKQAA